MYWHYIKSLGERAGKSTMANATETTAQPTGHMTYTQTEACFTQPVKDSFQNLSTLWLQTF